MTEDDYLMWIAGLTGHSSAVVSADPLAVMTGGIDGP
jgi:hypothetical protein